MDHRLVTRPVAVWIGALVYMAATLLHPVIGLAATAPVQSKLSIQRPFSSNQRLENYVSNTAMPVSRVLKQMSVKKMDMKKPKLIFLTIDDGPSKLTPQILDVLLKYNVKATFFVLGSQIKGHEATLRRAWAEGHAIANHSYHHLFSASAQKYRAEFQKTDALLVKALKPCTSRFCTGVIRIPGGSMGKPGLRKAFTQGKCVGINWNVSGADTAEKCLAASSIASNVKQWANKRQCVVVLDHDCSMKKSLPAALEMIIPAYLSKGYHFGTLCSDSSWRKAVAAGLVPRESAL